MLSRKPKQNDKKCWASVCATACAMLLNAPSTYCVVRCWSFGLLLLCFCWQRCALFSIHVLVLSVTLLSCFCFSTEVHVPLTAGGRLTYCAGERFLSSIIAPMHGHISMNTWELGLIVRVHERVSLLLLSGRRTPLAVSRTSRFLSALLQRT